MDLHTVLPCDATSVGTARRLVRGQLAHLVDHAPVDDEILDAASLSISELVTNAIVHARTDVAVRTAFDGGVLRVEVSDGNPALPTERRPKGVTGTGHGLQLIDAIATRWGVQPSTSGKTIWFELAYAN
jgi:anti-sigma regulatory factor (Ser/Thr protein kinase)